MTTDLTDLDATGLLAAATEAERAARLAEVHKLEVLAAWAASHSTDPTEGPRGARRPPGRKRPQAARGRRHPRRAGLLSR